MKTSTFQKVNLITATMALVLTTVLKLCHASVQPSPTDPGYVTYRDEKCSTRTATCTDMPCQTFMNGTATLDASGQATITITWQGNKITFTLHGQAGATINWTTSSNFQAEKNAYAFFCQPDLSGGNCNTHGLKCGNYNLFLGTCSGKLLASSIGWITTCGS